MGLRIGIFTNINKDNKLTVTKKVIGLFNALNAQVFLHESLLNNPELEKENVQFFNEQINKGFDLMISIGGDGTILRIASFCSITKTPVCGINLGRLGFLADIEPKNIDELICAIENKSYSLETRDILKVTVSENEFYALNEVAISRRTDSGMLLLNVSVNDAEVDNFYCDGFIVATSVGSTAYSLSAGGPILGPYSEAFSLTPINPHSLYSRPIVISNKEKIKLYLEGSSIGAGVMIDGVRVLNIKNKQFVTVEKADRELSFIRLNGHNFYSKLFNKFNEFKK